MTEFNRSTSPQDDTNRKAVLAAQSNIVTTLLFLALGIYLAVTTGAWQSYIFVAWLVSAETLAFFGVALIRRGQTNTGGWLFMGLNILGALVAGLLFVRVGYVAAAYILITSYFNIRLILPKESRRLAMGFSGLGVVLSILAEVINPAWRQSAQLMLTLAPIITAIIGIAFLVVVGYQAWIGSMRNKLLVAFIGVTLVATGVLAVYVFTTTSNILQQSLERQLTEHVNEAALRIGTLLNEQVNILTSLSIDEVLQQAVIAENQAYPSEPAQIQALLDAKDAQWQAADAADNNADPLVAQHLTSLVALELTEFQKTFPNNVEVFITDIYGGLTGTTNRTSDYYQADEGWWQAAYNDGQGAIYISEPEFDESASKLALLIAMPLRDRETGQIVGILRTTYQVSALGLILGEKVGETGETDLYVPGEVISHFHEGQYTQVAPEEFEALKAVAGQGMVEMDYEDIPSVIVQSPMYTLEGNSVIDNLGWVAVYHQRQDEAFTPVNAQVQGTLFVMVIVLALAVAAAFGLAVLLVRPITRLTQTAEEVAGGNLNSRAAVTSSDEIGTLANTFNTMTARLQETLEGLEERVADRTKALAIAAEVGRRLSAVTNPRQLAVEVVDQVQRAFNYYYAQIYLLDETDENLVLTGGTGDAGAAMLARGHSIPKGRGLVGRAAVANASVLVPDVSQEEGWLPNEMLPETRTEAAVPISVGSRVLGVLDVQHSVVNGLTDADVALLESLASQAAISLQNARTFEQSRKQAELETLANVIGQKIQRAATMEETLQVAIREIGLALGASRVSANIQTGAHDGDGKDGTS